MTNAIETGAALQLALEGSVVSARAGQRALIRRLIGRYANYVQSGYDEPTISAVLTDLFLELEKL